MSEDQLIEACTCGDIDDVEDLIRQGVNPAAQNNAAIIAAALYGQLDVVNRLLRDGRVNPATRFNSALKYAASRGHLPIVKRLLQDNRVDVMMRVILTATAGCQSQILQLLLCDWRVSPSKVPVDEIDAIVKRMFKVFTHAPGAYRDPSATAEVLRVWREDVGL